MTVVKIEINKNLLKRRFKKALTFFGPLIISLPLVLSGTELYEVAYRNLGVYGASLKQEVGLAAIWKIGWEHVAIPFIVSGMFLASSVWAFFVAVHFLWNKRRLNE